MEYLWKDAALLNLKTYCLKTTTMVVTAHNFEGQEFKHLGNYAPHSIHWGPSVVFSWLLGCSEGSKQLQWHAGCCAGDSWKLVSGDPSPSPCHLRVSPRVTPAGSSIGLLTQWLRTLRPRVPRNWKQKLPNHLKVRTRTNTAPFLRCSIGQSSHRPAEVHKEGRESPLLHGRMSESLQPSSTLQTQTHKKLETGGI